MSAFGANKTGLLSDDQHQQLIKAESEKLDQAGYEHLTRLDNHLLISYTLGQGLVREKDGDIWATHCVFDLYRKKRD